MRRNSGTRLILAGMATASLSIAACQGDDTRDAPSVPVVTRDTAHSRVDSAGGDVAGEFMQEPVKGRWITDGNAVSLMATMNAKQIAAADVELSAWHSDSVRAFAQTLAREHAGIQHSVDSVAGVVHVSPVAPALAQPIGDSLQAAVETLKLSRGAGLDRAFVSNQVNSLAIVGRYVQQLSAAAERPELQAVLAGAATRVGTQLARARALQSSFAAGDSSAGKSAADSAAMRAARRKR
jgi:putative membrane protein